MVQKLIRIIIVMVLPIVLITACGGLAGDPKIVSTLPPRVSNVVSFPTQHPDVALGSQIFAENCTECHGIEGKGDGPLVLQGQIPVPIPDFTDSLSTFDKSPQDWFTIITNGKLETLMPPWKGSLNDYQRWSVAMYVYTLAQDAQQREQGAEIWAAECAECHGDLGRGDGPNDVSAANLTNYERVLSRSNGDLLSIISQGRGDVMPAFGDTLDAGQLEDVVAHLRTFTLDSMDTDIQVVETEPTSVPTEVAVNVDTEATEEAAGAEATSAVEPEVENGQTVVITGSIVNGTEGGEVPEELPVTLFVMSSSSEPQVVEGLSNTDGTFQFDDVVLQEDSRYGVVAEYQDTTFFSTVVPSDPNTRVLDLLITINETTDDIDAVAFDYIILQMMPTPDGLQVVQIMNMKNETDRVFNQNKLTDGVAPATITITLPENAVVLDFSSQQRFGLVDDTTMFDTLPVLPGENHNMHVIYSIPYDGETTIDFPLDYKLDGLFQILVDEGVSIKTDELGGPIQQTMGESVFDTYDNMLTIAAGGTISFEVSGRPTGDSGTSATGDDGLSTNTIIAIILVVSSIVLFGVAGYLYWRDASPAVSTPAKSTSKPAKKQQPASQAQAGNQAVIDELVRQIAEMDRLFEEGSIAKAAYQEQRQRLKDRLADIMKK